MTLTSLRCGRAAVAVLCWLAGTVPASAQYVTRYTTTTNGAVTFTGNTLGLNKAAGSNAPGTGGSIGTFISTNLALRDTTPAPGWPAPIYNGTTASWQQNSSSATLTIPPGSTVLHAELVWGGSYSYGGATGSNVSAFLNNPVTFTTPAGTASVTPNPATARQLGAAGAGNTCATAPCYYSRTQDVTALVQAGGAGTYTVGGVPATESTSENNANNAGWTLAVVYQNFALPARNMSIFTGLQIGGSAPASVTGFCTPPSGTLRGRLAVSALEGDPSITGDEMRFGPTATLGAANRITGPNNPLTNFFASQMNGDTGALDVSGTFGTLNSTPGTGVSGARQGWDITNVDVSSQLVVNQTSAFAQGTTTGDQYAITTLGMQIDVAAPGFPVNVKQVDRPTTRVGEILTYTVSLNNTGTGTANNVGFSDPIPPGTTFVAGSVTVDGVAQPSLNPVTGFGVGNMPAGSTRTVTFQVQVTSIPAVAVYSNQAQWTFEYVSCAGQPVQNGTFRTNPVVTTVPRVVPTKTASPSPVVAGTPLTYTVAMPNTGTANATGVTLADPIPAGATYVAGTTTLNGVAVPDGPGATMPFVTAALVNSPGEPAGQVNVGESAVVTFRVLVDPGSTGTLTNTATIDPDGSGGQGTIPIAVATPISRSADVTTSKTSSPNPYVAGLPLTYTVAVSNLGPSNAPGTIVQDTLPAALPAATWTCTASGGASCPASGAGSINTTVNLPAGGAVQFVITGLVPPGTSGVVANTVTASLAAGIDDPVPGNNSATDTSPAGPLADLVIAKSSTPNPYVPGDPLTYTVTVNNLGPSSATGARVQDTFPGPLAGFTWTCAGVSGGSCVTASGTGSINTLVNLPAGAGATFTITGTVPVGTTGVLDNTATIAAPAGVTDPVPGNNSATAVNPSGSVADLSITKAGPDPYTPGAAMTYTVVVSNAGPTAAVNARVQDVLPAPLTTFTWTCTGAGGGTCATASGTGSIDVLVTLPPSATATFSITGTVPLATSGVLTNTATVTLPAGTTDPNTANNSATHNSAPTIIADLSVVKTSTPNPYVAGLPLSYTIVVANAGPSTATNARLQDTFPAPLAGFAWTCTPAGGAACGATSGTGGIDTVVTVPPGGTLTYVVSGTVPASLTGSLTNTATVTAPAGTQDPASGNNADTDVNAGAPLADLAVSKSSTPNPYVAGAPLTYTVNVLNLGPSDVVGATVQDTLPAALSAFTWSCVPSGGTCGAVSGTGNISSTVDLPAGTSVTYTITGTVPSGTTGQLLNTASLTAPASVTDPTPGNNVATDPNPAGPQADLTVTKSGTPSPYVPGAPLTYTVRVNNLGPSDVVGARVQDAVPAALALFSWACTPSAGAACGTPSGTGAIDALVNLTAGSSATFVITGTVPPGTTSALLNTASIAPPAGTSDPVPGNNTAADSNLAGPRADLTISKSGTPNPYVPGAPLSYTITVSNLGPSDVSGARVQDVLPPPLSAFPWTCSASGGSACGTAAGTGAIDTLVDLPAATSVTFTVSGLVPPSATGAIDNTATVATPLGTTDPVPGNNQSSNTNPVGPVADLTASKSSAPNPYVPGNSLTYTIVVSNLGPSNVTGARIQDVLPAPLAGFNWTCTGGSGATCVTASGSGNIDVLANLPASSSVTFVVTGTVPSGTTGPLLNTVTVAPPAGTTDPAPGNNQTSDSNPANALADLTVSKASTPNPYVPGLPLTYTVTVNNLGPSDVVGARVQDALPAPLGAFTWTCAGVGGGTCGTASGTGNIDALVTLAAGTSAVFTITGTVPAATTGGVVNSATATPPAGVADPTPGNNTATDSNPAGPQADLSVAKTSTPNPYVAGAPLTYTIVVSNAGPSAITGARVQDALPAPLSAFAWTCVGGSGGACGTASGSGNIDALVSLPVGATTTFVVTGTVPPGTVGQLLNTATVTPPPGAIDPVPGNNSATNPNPAGPQSDLFVVKTSTPNPYVPGLALSYTITVANAGPSNVLNARVQDALPPALASFAWTCTGASGGVCGAASGVGSIDALVDLPASGTVTFVLAGTVPASASGVIVNTATVTPPLGTTDPTPGNNGATDTNGAAPRADLTATKSSSPSPYVPGLPMTYTVVVHNLGPSDVVGAPVTDTLPAALSAFTWTCTTSTGTCGAASGTGNIATTVSLPAGETATFVMTGTVPAATTGQLSNVVTVAPPAGTIDPVPGNNTGIEDSLAGPQADLVATKSSAPNPYVPGLPLTYTVAVTNLGPSVVTGARVQDTLPAPLSTFTWTCAAASGAACGTASGAGNVDALVNLSVGASATFVVTGTVPSGVTGALANTATITPPAGTADPVPGNNAGNDVNNASASADLTISKSSSPDPYVAGQTLTYSIVVSNLGPSDALNSRVQDALPAPLSTFTWVCVPAGTAACTTSSGAGDIDALVDLPAGASVTFVVTGTVPSSTTGALVNTATVAPPVGVADAVPGNNQSTDTNAGSARADLTISKSSTPDPYVPGLALTYTIVVSNFGPSDAPLSRVQDTLPAPLAAFTWTCVPGGTATCATASGAGSIDALVSLPAGTSATFTVTGTVPSGTTGALVNTATVTPAAGVTDPVPGNNQASDTNPTNAQADLTITKSSTPDPYVPGLPLTYTIVVNNLGPSDALGARVQDALPGPLAAFGWVCVASGSASCGTPSGIGDIDAVVSLPAGTSAVFTVTGVVPSGTTGPLVNTASVIAPAGVADPVAGNNQATDSNPTNAQADLSISKTSTPDPYVPGLPLTYTITVNNAGPSDATSARVQDTLPAPFSAFTWTCAPGAEASCATASGSGDIDAFVTLPAGTAATFVVTGVVPAALTGPVANTATITPPPGVSDPVPGNNQSTNTNPSGAVADLVVSKSSAPDPYVPGAALTYTIVVSNLGPSDATSARVQDALPAGLPGFTWTCLGNAGGSCATASGFGDIDALVTVPAGASAVFTVTGLVPPGLTGALVNVVTVAPPAGVIDPVPGNNQAADVNPTGAIADLSVTKASTPNPYVPGAPLTYVVTVANAGPSNAVGARVQDLFPSALAAFTWTCTSGGGAACAAPAGSGSIDTLVSVPVGTSVSFTITGTVPPSTTGPLVNTVTVAAPFGVLDPAPGNNQAADVSPAGPVADLGITKVSAPNPFVAGSALTYTIVVTNAGPSTAANARVVDVLPAPLSSFTWTCTSAGGVCHTSGGSGDIDALVTLAPGATATFTVSGIVPFGTTNALRNVASVQPPPGVTDPTPANSAAVDVNQPLPVPGVFEADVCLVQSYPPVATAGGLIAFTYTATNRGPGAAVDLFIEGMIPAGTTFVSATPTAGGSVSVVNGRFVTTWPGNTFPGPGNDRTVTITLRVDPAAPPGTVVWNWFMTDSRTPDPYHFNNAADSYVIVTDGSAQADVVLGGFASASGVTASAVPVRVGQEARVRLTARNTGAVAARAQYALALDEMPAVEVTGSEASQGWLGISGPSSGVWETLELAPGATATLDLRFRMRDARAVKLLVVRVDGAPADPDATNDLVEIVLDGIGAAPLSGREVATGNVVAASAGGEILVANGTGESPQVHIYTAGGLAAAPPFFAFDRPFLGGLALASCDVDADGRDEIVVAQKSGGSVVRVLRMVSGVVSQVTAFQPFEPGFAGGVSIACADVDGDGRGDIVTGAGPGRAPDVRVFAIGAGTATTRAAFTAYEPDFAGGVRVSAARYPGGLVAPFEIVTTPGPGRPVDIRAWAVAGATATSIGQATVGADGGAVTSLGDADNDGHLDLAVMPDSGTPILLTLLSLGGGPTLSLPAGALGFTGSMRLAIGPLVPGLNDIVTVDGPGGLPRVQVFQLSPGGSGLQRLGFLALEVP